MSENTNLVDMPEISEADKNITWTILALSMRASDYIVSEARKGNL